MESYPNPKSANFYINLLRQIPGLIVVMDKDSRFIYSNDYTAKLFGYAHEEEIIGLDAYGMRCQASESAPQMIQQDQLVYRTGQELTMLDIHKYAYGDTKILLTKKTPYREQGEIVGTICLCTELHSQALREFCASLIHSERKYNAMAISAERSYSIGSTTHKKQLTERESDCIFYLLRGNTIKQIGRCLDISPRTVETYLEKIKNKLGCSHKSEIIEYCLNEGLLNYIPRNIFQQNISNVLYVSDGCS